jgi:hypothetical protein
MLNERTLRRVRSGTEKEVYGLVTDTALYIASGGFLGQANALLSALWKHQLPHGRDTWLADTAFMVLWDAAGAKPAAVPFPLIDIDVIEKQMRAYIAMDRYPYPLAQEDWTELSGRDLERKAFITAAMVKGNAADASANDSGSRFPPEQQELEALAMLERLYGQRKMFGDAYVLAAELAARHGKAELAADFIRAYVTQCRNTPENYNVPLVAASRHVAPLLLRKILAPEWGLTDSLVDSFTQEMTGVLHNRLRQGRSAPFRSLGWRELMERISTAAIAYDGEDDGSSPQGSGWLGFPGATPAEVKLAEERLSLELPGDYKDFLLVTDGFRAFPLSNPKLLSVNKIDLVRNILDPDLVDIMAGGPVGVDNDDLLEKYIFSAILISAYPDEQMIWLIPPRQKNGIWETWFYADWIPGAIRYPGFRFFMETQLNEIEDS